MTAIRDHRWNIYQIISIFRTKLQPSAPQEDPLSWFSSTPTRHLHIFHNLIGATICHLICQNNENGEKTILGPYNLIPRKIGWTDILAEVHLAELVTHDTSDPGLHVEGEYDEREGASRDEGVQLIHPEEEAKTGWYLFEW